MSQSDQMSENEAWDPTHGGRTRLWMLRALVVLATLPVPVAAYLLGIHALAAAGDVGPVQHFLRNQILLVVVGLAVSTLGGVLIWSSASALAQQAAIDTSRDRSGERGAERLPASADRASAVTPIERPPDQIARVASRLDRGHRELDPRHPRLDDTTFIDAATTLYNDRFFAVRLEQELARYQRFGRPLAVVLVDLRPAERASADGGGVAGDVLRGIGEALVKDSRAVDVVCRYRRHQLAVLLAETPRADAVAYASRVRDLVSTEQWSHGARRVTASVGVASLPDDARSGCDLVQLAADALDAVAPRGSAGAPTYGSGATPGARPEVETA